MFPYWCAVEQKALKECDRESMFNTDVVCIKVFTHPLDLIMFNYFKSHWI